MTPHEIRAVESLCRACRMAANALAIIEQDFRNADEQSQEGKFARRAHRELMSAVRRCHKQLGL